MLSKEKHDNKLISLIGDYCSLSFLLISFLNFSSDRRIWFAFFGPKGPSVLHLIFNPVGIY